MIEDAPVFYPSVAEFGRGPISYIAKIRSQAVKYGICKIVPPKLFQPPFAVDVNCFKFTPRLQRLNELEASVRTKLNFLDQLFKFWELQGFPLKVPYIEGRFLDLHKLYDCVKAEGGFEVCVCDRRWAKVTQRIGYQTNSHNRGTIASLLRHHYEKILYPYDIFLSGATIRESYSPTAPKSTISSAALSSSTPSTNTATNNSNNNGAVTSSISFVQIPPPTGSSSSSSNSNSNSSNNNNNYNSLSASSTNHGNQKASSVQAEARNSGSAIPPSTTTTTTNNISQGNTINGGSGCSSRNSRSSTATSPAPSEMSSMSASSSHSKELLKLRTYGAGPKMPGVIDKNCSTINQHSNNRLNSDNITTYGKYNYSSRMDCVQCNLRIPSHTLVTCDNCRFKFHITCLIPPLKDMPKSGAWHCHSCLALLVSKRPKHYAEFGFIMSQNHYTLAQFEQMANHFKSSYFKKACSDIPLSVVEQEYWRLVSTLEEQVCVEYGADLHCDKFGSGFPTQATKDMLELKNDEYIDHPWNLNNMPVAEGSVFKYINTNISGMIIPWMYVGMCFSTFCWHNEDHWTYSINYLHYGEAKTWYGVPGSRAEDFERSMKRVAPDLFESQPDLLHHLVTICKPSTLIEDKVPVYRVHQFAGEFVVTFPRAYHTGFNQGLNFAEAVNFAPADWLTLGRDCMEHYSSLCRFPVFSHDELICKMATAPSNLDYSISMSTYSDLLAMIEKETELRSDALDWGVISSERYMFENYPDDERQCLVCKTTCFLSAISCKCNVISKKTTALEAAQLETSDEDDSSESDDQDDDSSSVDGAAAKNQSNTASRLVCLSHRDKLCSKCKPKDHTLKFRYTLNELRVLKRRIKKHIMLFESGRRKDGVCDDSASKQAHVDKTASAASHQSTTSTGATKHCKTSHNSYHQQHHNHHNHSHHTNQHSHHSQAAESLLLPAASNQQCKTLST